MAQLEEAAAVADDVIDSAAEPTDATATLEDAYKDDKPAGDEPNQADNAADDDQADDDDAEDGDEQDNLPPINAPSSWKADEKEAFAALPRDVQETISRRETERDRFVNQKAQEAATAESRVMQQARQELARIHEEKAQEIQRYASMFMPQEPDARLLYTGNPQDGIVYQQQRAAYEAAIGQQQQLHQRAQAEAAEAQRIRQAEEQQVKAIESQRLQQELPEWFDPTEGPKLRQELQSIGELLGYPPELMAEANATDILGLKMVAELKRKADQYDALNRDKMKNVRAAKQLPRIAKPGAQGQGAQQPPTDPLKLLYPND